MPGKTRTCQRCKGLFKKWEFPPEMGHGRWICTSCYEKPRAQVTRHGATDPGWRRAAEYKRIETTYGICATEFDRMLLASRGKCQVCGDVFEGSTHKAKTEPYIDHCHASGRVRGLLCWRCNTILGLAKDSVWYLGRLAKYLDG